MVPQQLRWAAVAGSGVEWMPFLSGGEPLNTVYGVFLKDVWGSVR